ncbi:MAG: SDR family NAD(P)-dependent oxidoreductase [Dehalococcoidia bacterium]|nr:SDR family NAD(P)-dependent oxidoreductase [Dehalococcoidia bacterium]
MDIDGKLAVVTGAASGIGRATATHLSALGASLALVDLDKRGLAETARVIEEAGGEALSLVLDVSDRPGLNEGFESARRWKRRPPQIVINNAGTPTGRPPFPDADPDRWERVVDVNLNAVIAGTQIAIHAMRERGGTVINTASMAGVEPWPGDPVYSAAKGAVVFFTRALAALHESTGVRVNCVCPGVVDTPMVRRGMETVRDPEVREYFETLPMIPPHQVAEAMVALIKDDMLTGQAMRVSLEGNELIEFPITTYSVESLPVPPGHDRAPA